MLAISSTVTAQQPTPPPTPKMLMMPTTYTGTEQLLAEAKVLQKDKAALRRANELLEKKAALLESLLAGFIARKNKEDGANTEGAPEDTPAAPPKDALHGLFDDEGEEGAAAAKAAKDDAERARPKKFASAIHKKKKGPGKITGYNLYVKKYTPKVVESMKAEGIDTQTKEGKAAVFKKVGEKWKEVSKERKEEYKVRADKINTEEGRGAKA